MKPIILVLFFISIMPAAEKYDTKAFRTFSRLCTSCHGTPLYAAKQIDDDDWEFFFEEDNTLLSIHKDKPEAIQSLKNGLFKQRKKRLLKFLITNSKFSGTVHGCDSNFCGTLH